jgi:hypothetical protein
MDRDRADRPSIVVETMLARYSDYLFELLAILEHLRGQLGHAYATVTNLSRRKICALMV